MAAIVRMLACMVLIMFGRLVDGWDDGWDSGVVGLGMPLSAALLLSGTSVKLSLAITNPENAAETVKMAVKTKIMGLWPVERVSSSYRIFSFPKEGSPGKSLLQWLRENRHMDHVTKKDVLHSYAAACFTNPSPTRKR